MSGEVFFALGVALLQLLLFSVDAMTATGFESPYVSQEGTNVTHEEKVQAKTGVGQSPVLS